MTLIRSISGIRGIVNDGLETTVVKQHARAFSDIQPDGPFLISRDSRSHGESFLIDLRDAIMQSGRDVVNADIIPTPTAQFIVDKNDFSGGIVMTASHNPGEWNGMKFIDHDGCFLSAEQNKNLFQLADNNNFKSERLGLLTVDDRCIDQHVQHTIQLSVVNTNSIKDRQFTVVVDAVNGAASEALPALLRALNCKVFTIHCEPDGRFPRGPEPLPENLHDLGNAVKQHHADIGFASDPDGDRLAVVDENGNPLGEEYTLAFCLDGILSQHNTETPIVTNLSTSIVNDKIAGKYNNHVVRSAVGEINVVNLMKAESSIIGGEGNGGVILPESHYGRDSLVGVALFLNRLSQSDQTVGEIFASLPQYSIIKDKIKLTDIDPDIAIEKISSAMSDIEQNTIDGLKLIWEDKWVHIRKSNTEPIIRIYAEASTLTDAVSLIQKIRTII